MRNLRNFLPAMLLMISVSLLAGLASAFFASMFMGSGISSGTVAFIYKVTALSCAAAFCLVYGVRFRNAAAKNNRIRTIMSEEGVTPELLAILKRQADREKNSTSSGMAKLMLASYLVEGSYFQESFEVLESIDFEALPARYQDEYYNIYVYANLLMGDIKTADEIYNNSRIYFERARLRESNMPVLHTIGVLEYAKGNYAKAETLFMQAKNNAYSKQGKCECNLYLGLCYLKTDRADYAKAAAVEASSQTATVYQRRDLEKLMKLIEKAYLGSDFKTE